MALVLHTHVHGAYGSLRSISLASRKRSKHPQVRKFLQHSWCVALLDAAISTSNKLQQALLWAMHKGRMTMGKNPGLRVLITAMLWLQVASILHRAFDTRLSVIRKLFPPRTG